MTSRTDYGTLAWARRTSGRLSGVERVRQTFLSARARLVSGVHTGPVLPGFTTAADAERALAEIRPPDSSVVLAVATLIERELPPALVQHSWRTYLFARLLALRDGVVARDDVLVLASLLHDIGLGSGRDPARECFAHDGAERALEVLTVHGVDLRTRTTVAEAICLHLRVDVPVALGPEAHLVHAGTALDVTGARRGTLSRPAVEAVLRRHPRLDLVDVLVHVFEEERRQHPRSRVSHWMDLGFGRLIETTSLTGPISGQERGTKGEELEI